MSAPMKPSKLAHELQDIVAEVCGCQAAWDLDRHGNKILSVTGEQLVEIHRRTDELFWPERVLALVGGEHDDER